MRTALAPWLIVTVTACAPGRIALPQGPGAPVDEVGSLLAQVTAACRGVRTLVAELAISGRAGDRRLRGRVHAGFASPGSMRLEGVAPFGAPAFILVAQSDTATLVLPRQDRVLREAGAAAIVEALAGISLGPDDLRAVLSGCVTPEPEAAQGRRYADGWTAIDLRDGATAFVRTLDGEPHLLAATRGGLIVEYAGFVGRMPRHVRIATARPDEPRTQSATDITVLLAQMEVNTSLDPLAFTVDVPADAEPLTLDELRRAGPLGR